MEKPNTIRLLLDNELLLGSKTVGCKYCISSWFSKRRGLYGIALGLCGSCPTQVFLLHKAFYGLKQTPRAWFKRFSTQLLHIGFVDSDADGNLFLYNHNSQLAFLLLNVDDIIVTGNHLAFTSFIVHTLSQDFDLKDLGRIHYFLGL